MKSNKSRDWISISANVAVVAGLILVAIQINQNSTMIKSSSYQMWVVQNMEHSIASMDPNVSKALLQGNSDSAGLTRETFLHFSRWYQSFFQMVQATDYLYRQGTIERSLWEIEIGRAALYLSFPGVRQWWDAGGRTQLTPEFVELVESTPPTLTIYSWDVEKGFYSVEGI